MLRTLGSLELLAISADGQEKIVPAGDKALAFLAFLACSATRSASRERLAELLWGTSDMESALQSIRQARSSLKKLSGEELVTLDDTTLKLSSSVRTDRDEFRALLARDSLAPAIALYRGAFCEAFAAPGADDFERWAEVERTSLRSRCTEAIARLASKALSEARATEALALATRLSEVDPDDERHWRIRLEALLLKHDAFGVNAASSECNVWLSTEEREPSRALRHLLDRAHASLSAPVESETPGSAPRRALSPDLIGRERQFAKLLNWWRQAGAGESRCVVVVGASGMGKTRLLHDVQERLLATRAHVVSIRALPADSDIRFALAARFAASLASMRGAAGLSTRSAAVLIALNPALAAHFRGSQSIATAPDPLLAYIEALDELVAVVAEEHPLALLVDDLHWSDSASAQILASLGERQSNRRVLLVLAMRSRAVGAPRVPAASDVIKVEALTMEETDALLASIARLNEPAEGNWRGQLHRVSDGSPLMILETLRLSMDADCLAITGDGWTVRDSTGLSALLNRRSALADRLSRLDSRARNVALILATAGRPLADEALRQELRSLGDDAAVSLQRLEISDVVRIEAEGWVVAHDAVAENLVSSASATELHDAQACAARVLRRHADPASLRGAMHLFAAQLQWDDCADVVVRLAHADHSGRSSPHARAMHVLVSLANPLARAEVRRRLPFPLRVSVRKLSAAALLIAVATASLLGLWRQNARAASPQPTQLVVMGTLAGGSHDARAIDLRETDWNPSHPIEASGEPRLFPWPSAVVSFDAVRRGDGVSAIERFFPDSGGVDVSLWYPDGREERLTHSRGDDVPSGWAPDGSALLIETSRWGRLGHRAVATIDLKTRRVRRVSSGGSAAETDLHPAWSPDGSRIAFSRSYYTRRPAQLCIIDSDGGRESCRSLKGRSVGQVTGWLDPHRVLVSTDSSGVNRTEIISLSDTSIQSVYPADRICMVSPDGRWLACRRNADGALFVAPAASPERARQVRPVPDSKDLSYAWRIPRVDDSEIDRMKLTSPIETLPVGVGTLLGAEALTRSGEHVELTGARWSLADSSRGFISERGVLTPTRPGVLTVRVSAGGWRSAEAVFHAELLPASVTVTENWNAGVESRWRFFGQPLPSIVTDAGRRVFFNGGDGDHVSGAYLRRLVPLRGGFWIEAEVSTPITATQWQTS